MTDTKKHILVVVARRYNGHELWTALGTYKQRGHTFEVISTGNVLQDEITMRANRIKRTIDDVDPSEMESKFDALMIVSGNMTDTEKYWQHPRVLEYVRVAESLGKPIAAICCSVPTIRDAAFEKKVSYFPLVRSRELLVRAGAILQTTALTRHKNLVTAEHQMASQVWAEEFCNLLEGKPQEHIFTDSGFVPHGGEMMPNPHVEALRIKMGRPPTVIRKPKEPNGHSTEQHLD